MATETPPAFAATSDRQVAQAMELVTQLERDFAGRDALYRYVDGVIYGGVDAVIPKGYRRIGRPQHNPLAVYFTNTITAALTVDPPQVQYPARGPGEQARLNASLREHAFDASWQRQEEEAEAPLFRRFTHSVVCKGEGVLKTVPRRRGWGDYANYSKKLVERMTDGDLKDLDLDAKDRLYDKETEAYKAERAPYPIRSADVPPETFRYWKGDDGITLAVEHKRVPYLETLVQYGLGLDRDGGVVKLDEAAMGQALPPEEWGAAMEGTSTLTMSEIWTHDRCRYIVAGPGQAGRSDLGRRGTLVRAFRHRYGDSYTKSLRGPYAHCLGTTTASRLPERAGLGVLYGFLDLFVTLDELLTVQQINAVITGLAAYKRNGPPGQGLPPDAYGTDGLPAPRAEVRVEPGAILPFDVGPVEQPRAGAALGDTIASVREFIELILPKVLQGVVDTTDSGYQLALAARLGRIAFDPMVANIRRAAARRVGFESWLIEHEIGERVYMDGVPLRKPGARRSADAGIIGIGPEDLGGVHRYRVVLNPEDKASELVEVRKHREMVDGGFEDITDAIEALGGNAEEVEVKRQITRYKEKPETLAALDERVAQKMGLAEQKAVAAGDAALAGAGVLPQPQPQPGSALGGMGQVFEGGQTLPVAPGGPGMPAVPAQPPGGLPAAIPGQPPGVPAMGQQVNANPAMAGLGVV